MTSNPSDSPGLSGELLPWTTEPLRARLDAQFTQALQADPVCCGRVSCGTIQYLVDQAIYAAEAVGRHAARKTVDDISARALTKTTEPGEGA